MGIFDKIKAEAIKAIQLDKETPTPPPPPVVETFSINVVFWLQEHLEGIQKIRKINPEWYEKDSDQMKAITSKDSFTRTYKYKYRTYRVDLVPETNNAYDENAIKVLFNGKYVGYVPEEEIPRMQRYINRTEELQGIIKGGPVKYVHKTFVLDRCFDTELIIETK